MVNLQRILREEAQAMIPSTFDVPQFPSENPFRIIESDFCSRTKEHRVISNNPIIPAKKLAQIDDFIQAHIHEISREALARDVADKFSLDPLTSRNVVMKWDPGETRKEQICGGAHDYS